jgi:hypothetical protein
MKKTHILLYIIVLISVLVFLISYKSILIEGIEDQVSIPSGNNSADIHTIKGLRDFLEKMYFICLLNHTDVDTVSGCLQSTCYKVTILGTYLPLVADLLDYDMQTLFDIYGTQSQTTIMNTPVGPPPPIPIIASNADYNRLISLSTNSKLLNNIITNFPVWKRIDGSKQGNCIDICYSKDAIKKEILNSIRPIYISIKSDLSYFHKQKNPMNISYGDTYETALYVNK